MLMRGGIKDNNTAECIAGTPSSVVACYLAGSTPFLCIHACSIYYYIPENMTAVVAVVIEFGVHFL